MRIINRLIVKRQYDVRTVTRLEFYPFQINLLYKVVLQHFRNEQQSFYIYILTIEYMI